MRQKIARITRVIAEIRSRLDAARIVEREKIAHLDMQAQRLRCDAAMQYFSYHDAIIAECLRKKQSVTDMFGCGERHMQKLRLLWQAWKDYVAKRRAYDGYEFGLRLAFRLVGIPVDGGTTRHVGAGQNGSGTGGGDKGDEDEERNAPPLHGRCRCE